MTYPNTFPYDILQASPDDSNKNLRDRWVKICSEHPELTQNATLAYHELRKASSRLRNDILLITDIPGIENVERLSASIVQHQFLSGQIKPLPFSLNLTDLSEDQGYLNLPIILEELSVDRLDKYELSKEDSLIIRFDF